MDSKNKLRNSLIRRLQRLSKNKLKEISELLTGIESSIISKEKTLKLAGSWKDLDKAFFDDLTGNLHKNRKNDRQIP